MSNRLLFATPRTGSNFILVKLGNYNLGEFFGGNAVTGAIVQEKIAFVKRQNFPSLKIFPSHLSNSFVRSFLEENYIFVCLRRKNLLNQILSYGIAVETNRWIYSNKHVVELAPKSVYYNRNVYDTIVKEIRFFYRYLSMLNCNKEFITYEDKIISDKGKTPYIFNRIDYFINKQEILEWIDEFQIEIQPQIDKYYK